MSARESLDAASAARTASREPHAPTPRLDRWPAFLAITLGVLLGPMAALVCQGSSYVANVWACSSGGTVVMQIVPAVCLAAACAGGGLGWIAWRSSPRGEAARTTDRPGTLRFGGLLGMSVSALSAAVIVAQWIAVSLFAPCLRV